MFNFLVFANLRRGRLKMKSLKTTTMIAATMTITTTTPAMAPVDEPDWPGAARPTNNIYFKPTE